MWSEHHCPVLQSDAIDQYCQAVEELVGSESKGQPEAGTNAETSSKDYKEIIVTKEGGALTITLNRPKKYNALNYQVHTHK